MLPLHGNEELVVQFSSRSQNLFHTMLVSFPEFVPNILQCPSRSQNLFPSRPVPGICFLSLSTTCSPDKSARSQNLFSGQICPFQESVPKILALVPRICSANHCSPDKSAPSKNPLYKSLVREGQHHTVWTFPDFPVRTMLILNLILNESLVRVCYATES